MSYKRFCCISIDFNIQYLLMYMCRTIDLISMGNETNIVRSFDSKENINSSNNSHICDYIGPPSFH